MGETEHVSISKGTIHSGAHVEGRWERVLGFVTCFRFFFFFLNIRFIVHCCGLWSGGSQKNWLFFVEVING